MLKANKADTGAAPDMRDIEDINKRPAKRTETDISGVIKCAKMPASSPRLSHSCQPAMHSASMFEIRCTASLLSSPPRKPIFDHDARTENSSFSHQGNKPNGHYQIYGISNPTSTTT